MPGTPDRFSRALVRGIATIAAAAALVTAGVAAQSAGPGPTLYERLGGYDGISSYIALVFPRVAGHPSLSHLFRGHGRDSQQRQFQLVVELVCKRTGGPCAYIGRDMPTVHDGLAITEDNWTAFMSLVRAGIEEKKYPPDVARDFLEMWQAFHDDVVRR